MTLPLAEAVQQCRRHADVLTSAMADLPPRFAVEHVRAPDPGLVRTTDQFVLRFIKLQDTLGEHVLRTFTGDVLGEPVSDLPLIDVLNRLERYGFLELRRWARWSALRNSLTHEYPEHPEIRAALLNEALDATPGLVDLLDRIQQRVDRVG